MARHKDVPQGDFGPPMKFDPHFNGPVHRRSCTDIICLVLFLVFIGCWVATSIYAIGQGDVRKLLVPTDTEGRKCGLDSQVKDYPHLVFFDMKKCIDVNVPIYGCPTTQACVKKCPTTTFMASDSSQVDALEMDDIRERLVCKPEIVISDIGSKDRMYQLMDSGDCARDVYRSKSILGRCLGNLVLIACDAVKAEKPAPKGSGILDTLGSLFKPGGTLAAGPVCRRDEKAIKTIEQKTSDLQFGAMVIEDLVNARWWLLLSLFLVMIFCLFYITLMRWIAGPVTWFTMLAIVGLLSYSVYLTYDRYAFYRDNPVLLTGSDTNLAGVARSVTSMKETWLVLMIVAIITLVVILLMLIFLRKRIVLAIALIKEASRAVGSVKSTLFFPIFPWVLEVGLLAYGIVICLYLASIGDDNYRVAKLQTSTCSYTVGQKCDPDQFAIECGGVDDAICHFTGIINPQYIYWLQALNVAAFFWSEFFVQGVGDMILAGVFATWYWTFKKSDVPFFALTRSIARTCFYNLGTVAFGSLIITICRLIRVCLEYIDQKTKKWDNGFTKCILCLCKCFFACLESFLKFINKNAYIMCAIHGKGFISSAKEAFSLLMRNVVRVFVLDKVTDFLFFLSKLVVAVLCGVAAYFALSSPKLYDLAADEQLHYDLTPAIVVGVAAYLIASVFFGVYAMAVDTLFLCFLEDCERNDGSPERPYFMSKQLMKILGKKNK